jgi:hypothetical protein
MQQSDYIERLIRQVAQAIAAALGLAHAGDPQRALEDLDATWSSAIGLRRADLERLDAKSLRAILGPKCEAAVRLLEAAATLQETRGDIVARDATRRLLATLSSS